MNQVKAIIQKVLEDNHVNEPYVSDCNDLANQCEKALTLAVVEQVADLLGGSVEVDNDGQAVIYTGVNF